MKMGSFVQLFVSVTSQSRLFWLFILDRNIQVKTLIKFVNILQISSNLTAEFELNELISSSEK